jgi:dTDP-4-amino-4,6-dideoxygalactose transaminase
MSNFGFGKPRNATLIGLNGKMSEIAALLATLRLESFDAVMARRTRLMELYRQALPELHFQPPKTYRQAHQFTPTLLPHGMAPYRPMIQAEMRRMGVESASYFSPHVAEQDYFRDRVDLASLPVTKDVASRALTLPLFDTLTNQEVQEVAAAVKTALALADANRKPGMAISMRNRSYGEQESQSEVDLTAQAGRLDVKPTSVG